jgi:hypothetical protein
MRTFLRIVGELALCLVFAFLALVIAMAIAGCQATGDAKNVRREVAALRKTVKGVDADIDVAKTALVAAKVKLDIVDAQTFKIDDAADRQADEALKIQAKFDALYNNRWNRLGRFLKGVLWFLGIGYALLGTVGAFLQFFFVSTRAIKIGTFILDFLPFSFLFKVPAKLIAERKD